MRRYVIFTLLVGVFAPTVAMAVPAEGHRVMYAGPSPYSLPVVKRVTEQGGNVVDCAVAVALTLSVTSPYFAGLGGGGFALVKMHGKAGASVEALDFRETAPQATGRDYYKDLPQNASRVGGSAVGVPGIPAGLWALHQKHGKLKWSQLFDEALMLATQGFAVSGEWATKTKDEKPNFNAVGKVLFSTKSGGNYRPGEIFKQPRLATALKKFRAQNIRGFYSGPVAQDIVSEVKATGGAMTLQDLQRYQVRWMKPMIRDFAGYKIYLMPPPSSGGVVISTALELIEALKLKDHAYLSTDELHMLAEIQKRSFRGRALLGDPEFSKLPLAQLLSPEYLNELKKTYNHKKSTDLAPLDQKAFDEKRETTHFSIVDAAGNSVAMTVTLNGNYGSGVVTPRFGLALNNEMDDFTTTVGVPNMYGLIQGEANAVAGGKRPLSSMSPTLVEKDGQVVLSVGSPGGPRIISGVLQVLYRHLVQKHDIDKAIQAPRVHQQFLPNKLYVEPQRFSPEILKNLRDRRHVVEESWTSKVYAVAREPGGLLSGAFDNRGEGAAGGI